MASVKGLTTMMPSPMASSILRYCSSTVRHLMMQGIRSRSLHGATYTPLYATRTSSFAAPFAAHGERFQPRLHRAPRIEQQDEVGLGAIATYPKARVPRPSMLS